jgi:ribose 5-phosphate isomerase A
LNPPNTSLPDDRQSKLKQEAAEYAVQFVESGMVVGLGTGSTAIFATRRIAELLKAGTLKNIVGFATSKFIWEQAQQLGIPLMDQAMPSKIDVTIDGADEVDPKLNLIKGGGGALFREKIVAQASDREIIIVDDSKLSPCLGTKHTLPVEVNPFGWQSQLRFLQSLGARASIRHNADGTQFVTDSGNMILDCDFGPIGDAADLAAKLGARAGIVEHGLFLGSANDIIVASEAGVRHLKRTPQGAAVALRVPPVSLL